MQKKQRAWLGSRHEREKAGKIQRLLRFCNFRFGCYQTAEIDSSAAHADVSLHLTSMKLFMRDSYAVLENNIVFVNEKILDFNQNPRWRRHRGSLGVGFSYFTLLNFVGRFIYVMH